MSKFFFLCMALLLIGCASQRQKPVCAEIQYRLDHLDQSPDQRAWLEDELRDCKAQQEEYAKSDTLTNKVKKSIYELYEESKKDSSKTKKETLSSSSSAAILYSSLAAGSSSSSGAPLSSAAVDSSAVMDK